MVNASVDILRCIYIKYSGMDSRDYLPRGTLRPFLSFKRQEGVFRAFQPEEQVKQSNDPPKSPPEI